MSCYILTIPYCFHFFLFGQYKELYSFPSLSDNIILINISYTFFHFLTDFLRIPRITSFLGGDLPTPREISLKFFTDSADESIKKNNLFTIFARFVEHDLYYTKLLDGKLLLLLAGSL